MPQETNNRWALNGKRPYNPRAPSALAQDQDAGDRGDVAARREQRISGTR
jgi:hypothetical protein